MSRLSACIPELSRDVREAYGQALLALRIVSRFTRQYHKDVNLANLKGTYMDGEDLCISPYLP